MSISEFNEFFLSSIFDKLIYENKGVLNIEYSNSESSVSNSINICTRDRSKFDEKKHFTRLLFL